MATNFLHSVPQTQQHNNHHHHPNPPPLSSASFFLKATTNSRSRRPSFTIPAAAAAAASSSSPTSTTTTTTTTSSSSTSQAITFDTLQQHLIAKNYRQADEETRRLLIALAGDAAVKRGYVFFSEVQFIAEVDLKAIDALWRQHSDDRFGYSVQKKIWEKANKDFTKFFIKLGWMKKLDTEVEQYNYRSFPTEFIWELDDNTPEGHLPLTNALRGTQLFTCILNHPAFKEEEDGGQEEEEGKEESGDSKPTETKIGSKPLSKNLFKTDYSF